MPKIVKKSFLKGYSPAVKIVGGIVVAATVITGVYFGYRYVQPKFTKVTSVSPQAKNLNTNTAVKKIDFNGTYVGNSSTPFGLSDIEATVSGSKLTGKAVYNAQNLGKINVTISGNVETSGRIIGTFSGSGSILRMTVNVTGNYQAQITGSSMNVSYSASVSSTKVNQTFPSQATLTKK